VEVALDGNMPSALWVLKFSIWQKGREQLIFSSQVAQISNFPLLLFIGSHVLMKAHFASS